MKYAVQINPRFAVGPQPDELGLTVLKNEGYQAIVNLLSPDEQDEPLGPAEERWQVERMGLNYVHLPVTTNGMNPEQVDRFRERCEELPKPVFVHCKAGKRSGALVLMHAALEEGLSGDEALERARRMGIGCDSGELGEFVSSYIDGRRS